MRKKKFESIEENRGATRNWRTSLIEDAIDDES